MTLLAEDVFFVLILLLPEISRVLGLSPPFDLNNFFGKRRNGPLGLVAGLSPLEFWAAEGVANSTIIARNTKDFKARLRNLTVFL